MGRKKPEDEYEIRRALQAIRGSNGNKTIVAKTMKISRSKFDIMVERNPVLMQALLMEQETGKDMVENVIMEQIKKGNTAIIIFFAKTKMKDRGYIENEKVGTRTPRDTAAEIRKYQRAMEASVPLAPEGKRLKLVANNDRSGYTGEPEEEEKYEE